ncbi:hypothetical protein PM082_000572 [Marasmius tenuissimus]|nr:hypothetical protein PM082_000572 [Marasmius tenuissimus]
MTSMTSTSFLNLSTLTRTRVTGQQIDSLGTCCVIVASERDEWKTYANHGGQMKTLRKHLQKCHPDVWRHIVKAEQLKGWGTVDVDMETSANGAKTRRPPFEVKGFYERLVKFIAAYAEALNIMDCQEFRDLLDYVGGEHFDTHNVSILHRDHNTKEAPANKTRWDLIFRVTVDVLPAQASAVPCERVFSSSKQTDASQRSNLSPEMFEILQILSTAIESLCTSMIYSWTRRTSSRYWIWDAASPKRWSYGRVVGDVEAP